MDNIVSAKLDSRYASTLGVWQYDYGQVLRITGPELPPAVEVQFSLDEKSGETLSRVGTTVDGVTEVKIPDELLKHSATSNYRIYAYIYLTDETSGNTKYEIIIPVRVRSKPTSPAEDPETDPDLFRETVVAVNASAERAKMAEQNAKESAAEAGKYAASASESAVTAEKTKEDALRKVGEKKQEAIEAIQNQEETSVGKITTHTDGEIQRIQNQTAESKGELEQTIINAGVSEEELDESIQTASDTKTALDKSVELAGTAKPELDTSIREAGTAKTALDESTETAGTVQETLSATVKQAGALDTSLGEKIKTGTQLKTDLVTSGEKAVQDIQAAGSEQLGKMQAVAEAFTADREQIATNKEDIGSLKGDLENVNNNVFNVKQTVINVSYDSNTFPDTSNGVLTTNVNYSSGSIQVEEGETYHIEGCSFYEVALYGLLDSSGNLIDRYPKVAEKTKQHSVDIRIPSGCTTLMIGKRSPIQATTYIPTVIKISYDSRIEKLENESIPLKSSLDAIGIPYTNLGQKPSACITLIDDDGYPEYIPTIKNICDNLGIKCTFAVNTGKWTNESVVSLLQSYQNEGFHITSHSHSHSKKWSWGAIND